MTHKSLSLILAMCLSLAMVLGSVANAAPVLVLDETMEGLTTTGSTITHGSPSSIPVDTIGSSGSNNYAVAPGYDDSTTKSLSMLSNSTGSVRFFDANSSDIFEDPYLFSFAVQIDDFATTPSDGGYKEVIGTSGINSAATLVRHDWHMIIDATFGTGGTSIVEFYAYDETPALSGYASVDSAFEGGSNLFNNDGTQWQLVFVHFDQLAGNLSVWLNPTSINQAPDTVQAGFFGGSSFPIIGWRTGETLFGHGDPQGRYRFRFDNVKIWGVDAGGATSTELFETAYVSYSTASVADWSFVE